MSDLDAASVIAQALHNAYEDLAPRFDYETRRDSAVAWVDVPPRNRALMTATVGRLLALGIIAPGPGDVS